MANFSDAQKQTAWNKAKIVENDNDKGKVWRKDLADAWIKFTDYGDQESDYGWEVDHAFPESKGGGTEDYNIQAMNWHFGVGMNILTEVMCLILTFQAPDGMNIRIRAEALYKEDSGEVT